MKINIDGKECTAEEGEFILQIAKRNGISIPTLCYSESLDGLSACRLCIVEVERSGRRKVVTSCNYPVKNEINVYTHSDKIISMRKTLLMLIASRLIDTTPIKELLDEYEVKKNNRFINNQEDNCIMCGLCVKACEILGSNAIGTAFRGINKKISTPFEEPPQNCIGCTSCASVCPVGAIKYKDEDGIRHIWNGKFKLVKCEQCGSYYATEKQIEYIKEKVGEIENIHLCERCKKKLNANNFKEVFQNIKLNNK